jgi:hypothetical protein
MEDSIFKPMAGEELENVKCEGTGEYHRAGMKCEKCESRLDKLGEGETPKSASGPTGKIYTDEPSKPKSSSKDRMNFLNQRRQDREGQSSHFGGHDANYVVESIEEKLGKLKKIVNGAVDEL